MSGSPHLPKGVDAFSLVPRRLRPGRRRIFVLVEVSSIKTSLLEKTCSIGFKSGEYFGRKSSFAPASRMAERTPLPLWLPRLSITTIWPGRGSTHLQ